MLKDEIIKILEKNMWDLNKETDQILALIRERLPKERKENNLISSEKCECYLDHQPVWDGNYFTCKKCGKEFVPATYVNQALADIKSILK